VQQALLGARQGDSSQYVDNIIFDTEEMENMIGSGTCWMDASAAASALVAEQCSVLLPSSATPPLLSDVLDMTAQVLLSYADGKGDVRGASLGMCPADRSSLRGPASASDDDEGWQKLPCNFSPAALKAVSHCLCGHYGVRRVEALGFGPTHHLAEIARSSLANRGLDSASAVCFEGRLITSQGRLDCSSTFHAASPALVSAHALVAVSSPIAQETYKAGATPGSHDQSDTLKIR
jgi:hypothetical protein